MSEKGKFLWKAAQYLGSKLSKKKENSGKKMLMFLIALPILFVVVVVVIIYAIFQMLLCTIPFVHMCGDKTSYYEQAITEDEMEKIWQQMKTTREDINNEVMLSGGTPGENYQLLQGGSNIGGDSTYPSIEGPYVEQVKAIIAGVESGNYGAAEGRDPGGLVAAMTIGKYQMTGDKAAAMLILIRSLDKTTFDTIIPPDSSLGQDLQKTPTWAFWSHRPLDNEETKEVSNALVTDAGKKGQEEYMDQLVGGYLEEAQKAGITDPKAKCFAADIDHQSSVLSWRAYLSNVGSPPVTLQKAYDAAMQTSPFNDAQYHSRRQTVFAECNSVTDNSTSGSGASASAASATLQSYEMIKALSDGTLKSNLILASGGSSGGYTIVYNSKYDDPITAAMIETVSGKIAPGRGADYIQYGKEYGVDPAFLASIGVQESGNNGSALSAPPFNNLGGIKCPSAASRAKFNIDCGELSGSSWAKFSSISAFIQYQAYLIGEDYIKGSHLTTVGTVKAVYCTSGCGNWIGNVNGNMKKIYQEANVNPPTNGYNVTIPDSSGSDALNSCTSDCVEEADIHLRTLIQIDQYALAGLNLKESDLTGNGKYANTILGDMWKLTKDPTVKKFTQKREQKNWTIEDKIMSARTLVYQCYLVGSDNNFWDFLTGSTKDDPCQTIHNALGKDLIPPGHQAELTQTENQQVYYTSCKEVTPPTSNTGSPSSGSSNPAPPTPGTKATPVQADAGGKQAQLILTSATYHDTLPDKIVGPSSCGPNEELVKDKGEMVESIKYPSLVEILKNFEPYSLAIPDKTIDSKIDGDYSQLVDYYLNQLYDANGVSAPITSAAPMVDYGTGVLAFPVEGGMTNLGRGFSSSHNGIDFARGRGTPVYAAADGVVVAVRTGTNGSTGYGNLVMIKHNINGKTLYTLYGHLLNNQLDCPKCVDGGNFQGSYNKKPYDYYDPSLTIQVKEGQTVKRGQLIAYTGDAGQSTGWHLHFGTCTDQYTGCIDPAPLLK